MENHKNPLQYFEDLLEYNKVDELKDDFIRKANEEFNNYIENIDVNKGIITYLNTYFDSDAKGISSTSFESTFIITLYSEFQKSKLFINDYVFNNPDNYLPFLYHQGEALQYLINRGESTIIKYSVILKPILGIQRYINEKYLYNQEKQINIDLSHVETNQLLELTNYNNDTEIIEIILGYLKGNNDKREKIMSDEQYHLMINNITYYLDNERLPENIQKISHLKIPKNLLRFTFWVLHKQLFTTSQIKDDFLHLIKSMFSDFNNWEFSTFKTKFGNRDKVTIHGKKFVPEIIKIEFRNRS
ncbi:hypothetical protein A0O34_05260 [Chryseobacterium glaciei]|uniref:Uncharacterized protein n=1 Tax=Chryseobacterium glaciei TaxID=1685010 RepID=A0A172XSN1_9FLAO|nr:hypothetical protein [Chryseobacterium glaciei]ANF49971.1 hypothetical protein A0O34_05260 [Chryseobacterium glaciei]